jgi:hypothetical protein
MRYAQWCSFPSLFFRVILHQQTKKLNSFLKSTCIYIYKFGKFFYNIFRFITHKPNKFVSNTHIFEVFTQAIHGFYKCFFYVFICLTIKYKVDLIFYNIRLADHTFSLTCRCFYLSPNFSSQIKNGNWFWTCETF